MAIISNPFEIFFVKICVTVKTIPTKIPKYSMLNTSAAFVKIKNHNDSPAVTAMDLNLGDEVCILNWINECD